jgi:hypothetical protein
MRLEASQAKPSTTDHLQLLEKAYRAALEMVKPKISSAFDTASPRPITLEERTQACRI